MSFEAILWAHNDAPIADVNEFAVLGMLAEKADADGCNAFPSQPTVAARTRIDPKTVRRCMQAMEQRGLIHEGDQRAAEYIRADKRPRVYDLMIPYSWFPNIERINRERRERGRPPLTPQDRPDLPPAPPKKERADKGSTRTRVASSIDGEERGDFESPRDEQGSAVHEGTTSPQRGDYKSGAGGLVVPQPSPCTQSFDPDHVAPSARSAPDARGAGTGSRPERASGSAASGKDQRLTPQQGKQIQAVLREFPDHLAKHLPAKRPKNLSWAILDALATGTPHERTPQQLVEFRALARWDSYWGSLFGKGEVKHPVGAIVRMLEYKPECGNPRCDDRRDVDTGQPCISCALRVEDKRQDRQVKAATHVAAEHEGAATDWYPETADPDTGTPPEWVPQDPLPVPQQRPVPNLGPLQNCDSCDKAYRGPAGLCGVCREEVQYT